MADESKKDSFSEGLNELCSLLGSDEAYYDWETNDKYAEVANRLNTLVSLIDSRTQRVSLEDLHCLTFIFPQVNDRARNHRHNEDGPWDKVHALVHTELSRLASDGNLNNTMASIDILWEISVLGFIKYDSGSGNRLCSILESCSSCDANMNVAIANRRAALRLIPIEAWFTNNVTPFDILGWGSKALTRPMIAGSLREVIACVLSSTQSRQKITEIAIRARDFLEEDVHEASEAIIKETNRQLDIRSTESNPMPDTNRNIAGPNANKKGLDQECNPHKILKKYKALLDNTGAMADTTMSNVEPLQDRHIHVINDLEGPRGETHKMASGNPDQLETHKGKTRHSRADLPESSSDEKRLDGFMNELGVAFDQCEMKIADGERAQEEIIVKSRLCQKFQELYENPRTRQRLYKDVNSWMAKKQDLEINVGTSAISEIHGDLLVEVEALKCEKDIAEQRAENAAKQISILEQSMAGKDDVIQELREQRSSLRLDKLSMETTIEQLRAEKNVLKEFLTDEKEAHGRLAEQYNRVEREKEELMAVYNAL